MNPALIFMVLVVVLESFSDILAKEWSLKSNNWMVAVALSGYLVTNIFWLYALKNGIGLTRGAVIFSVGSAILGVLIGILFYKETLTSLQTVGVMLGLMGAIMIFWE